MKKENITYQTTSQMQIFLNSAQADVKVNGTMKSDCVFFFDDIIEMTKNAVDVKISVANAQIPISYYLINDFNNQINISTTSINQMTHTFYNGNYTALSFITIFDTMLGSNFTININHTQNTFTFINSVEDFTFSDIGINSIFELIGFQKGNTYTSINKTLTAPFPFNFSGINRINVRTSSFKTQNFNSINKSRCETLASIPIYAPSNGICFYSNITQFKASCKFSNANLTSINVQLQDDYDNFIDFQNQNWTICLQVDILSEEVEDLKTFEGVYEGFKTEYYYG